MTVIVERALANVVFPVRIITHNVHYTNGRCRARFHAVIIRGGESGVKHRNRIVNADLQPPTDNL